MKCLNCGYELEKDDNFCPICGHWSAKGYAYFNDKNNLNEMMKGYEVRQDNKLSILVSLISLGIVLFIGMLIFRGNNLFRPLIFIKREIDNYKYGYYASVMKSDNIYHKTVINDIDDAYNIIRRDFDSQTWKCMHDIDTYKLEEAIEEKHDIPSVNFCDIKYAEVLKIKEVIDNIYDLFSDISGTLTNITVTNALSKGDYIAYFQPMFEFVNPGEDINVYNRVNKTQILLNSYYFLNDNILNSELSLTTGDNYYVNDATWESTIAHEFGHYITFKAFLKSKNIDNIVFVDYNNQALINDIMNEYDSGAFAKNIVKLALDSYNTKYNYNLDMEAFAKNISVYASVTDDNGNIVFDETIAEAIHDYYLHRENCKHESYEIVNVIKKQLR